jgi:hypothetical protein
MLQVNYLAIVVAAVANFIIGFLFHGPLFGKLWMKLANITPTGNEKFSDMYGQMFWNFVSNLVFAFVLSAMINFTGALGATRGMAFAFWVWLGFVVTSSSMEVIWMGRSYKLWLFEIVSSLVSVLVMGAIIASW